MKNNSHHRLLTPTPSAFRMYEENYKDFMSICGEEGRKPAEVLRDAIDEWLQMRRATASGAMRPQVIVRSWLDIETIAPPSSY